MFLAFFVAAMRSPGRQTAFRRVAVAHVVLLSILGYLASLPGSPMAPVNIGYALLILGLVEGAALVGWRLTQMPKSQALEFYLTSPIQPRRLFLVESLVGISFFTLIQLSGVPVLCMMVFGGIITWDDFYPLLAMPMLWGLVTGLGITSWVYEPIVFRRVGELFALLGVLVYLVIGVLAGENLRLWLEQIPESVGKFLFDAVLFFHTMNPFGVVRYWFASDRADWLAWDRFVGLNLFAAVLVIAYGLRAAFRLKGHFHDRHYRPIASNRESQLDQIGDRPLSWWAVRRVMEYSGRVNLWLAGGFSILYAAYIVAGDQWPAWMGRLVFQIFETWGGAPMIATALAVMAAVPAVFQFGLWDPTVQDRCRRLELLLLTELGGEDYWHASLSAAWRRGRGYLVASIILWLALGISGRNSWPEVIAVGVGGVMLWMLSFAVGFRSFATGAQGSGLASMMTLGFPLILFGLLRLGLDPLANLLPVGLCYMPVRPGAGLTLSWFVGVGLTAALTIALTRHGLANCEANLRRWLDRHQGMQVAG